MSTENLELEKLAVRLAANLHRALNAYENGVGDSQDVRDLAQALQAVRMAQI